MSLLEDSGSLSRVNSLGEYLGQNQAIFSNTYATTCGIRLGCLIQALPIFGFDFDVSSIHAS